MKIENIILNDSHIGKIVTYHDNQCNEGEVGKISSWNDSFVFIKYSANTCATRPNQIYWNDRLLELKNTQAIINSLGFNDIINIEDVISYQEDGLSFNINIRGYLFTLYGTFVNPTTFLIFKKDEPIIIEARRNIQINTLIQ